VDSCSVLSIALCDRMSLTFEDVLSFPQEARVCFSSQPERYLQFFDAVSKYAAEEYDSFIRSTSKSRPNNIRGKKCLPVRPSVRPSVHKKFLQFE